MVRIGWIKVYLRGGIYGGINIRLNSPVKRPAPVTIALSLPALICKSAALTAATNVVWFLESMALTMMSLLGYMAAPPTITVCSAADIVKNREKWGRIVTPFANRLAATTHFCRVPRAWWSMLPTGPLETCRFPFFAVFSALFSRSETCLFVSSHIKIGIGTRRVPRDMAEASTEQTPPSGGSSSGGGGKLVMIISGVNLLATLGIVAVLMISFNRDSKKPKVEDIVAEGASAHGGAKEEGGEHGGSGEHGGGEHGSGGEHGGAGEAKKPIGNFGKMLTLDQFTVNLSTPGTVNPKFVRVNISIEVPTADAESEVTQKMPQVRNAIIDLFNSKRPADLATAEGRDYIKEEIRNALNSFMVSGKVKGVFFTGFAVSS